MIRLSRLLPLLTLALLGGLSAEEGDAPTRTEKVYFRIARVLPGYGQARLVEVEGGREEGVVAGRAGSLFSIGGTESAAEGKRDVEAIGRASVVSTQDHACVVRVVMDRPEGHGMVRPGDLVEFWVRTPKTPRSILWGLSRLRIVFTDNTRENAYNEYSDLLHSDSPEEALRRIDLMRQDIRECAEFTRELATPQKGRFAGRNFEELMKGVTREDLVAFFQFVEDFPGKYIGHRWKIAEVFATWALNDSPIGGTEAAERFLACGSDEERRAMLVEERDFFLKENVVTNWLAKARALVDEPDFARAEALIGAAGMAIAVLPQPEALPWLHFSRGYVAYFQAKYEEAAAGYRQAIESLEARRELDSDLQDVDAVCRYTYSDIRRRLGDMKEAISIARRAIERCVSHGGLARRIADLHTRLGEFHFAQGDYADAMREYGEGEQGYLALEDEDAAGTPLLGRAKTLAQLGRNAEAAETYERARAIHRRTGDRKREATALREAGDLRWRTGDYRGALGDYQECLAIRRDLGDRAGEADALAGVGTLQSNLGEYDAAVVTLEQTLQVRRDLKDRAGEASSLKDLAWARQRAADYERALPDLEAALAIWRDLGDRSREAELLAALGGLRENRYEYQAARECYDGAVALYAGLGAKAEMADALLSRAGGRLRLADHEGALADQREALRIAREIDARGLESSCLSLHGLELWNTGAREEGLPLAQRALEIAVEIADRPREAMARRILGRMEADRYRFGEAILLLEQALALYRAPDLGDTSAIADTLMEVGGILAARGDLAGARARYEEAWRVAEASRARRQLGSAAGSLAEVLLLAGEAEEARRQRDRCVELLGALRDPWAKSFALSVSGRVDAWMGDHAKAIATVEEELAIKRAMKLDAWIAPTLNSLGWRKMEAGDLEGARTALDEALALAQKVGDRGVAAVVLVNLGLLHRERGELDEARARFEEAQPVLRDSGLRYLVAENDVYIGDVQREIGERHLARGEADPAAKSLREARAALDEALAGFASIGSPAGEALALVRLGALQRAQGDLEGAEATLAAALERIARVRSVEEEWRACDELGRVREARGDLPGALQARRRAVAILDDLGARAGGDGGRLLLKSRIGVYEALAALLDRVGRGEADPARRRALSEEALALVARARNAARQENLRGFTSTGSEATDATIARLNDTEQEARRLERERQEALAKGNSERAENLAHVLADTEEKLAEVYVDLKAEDADLAQRLQFDPRRVGGAMSAVPGHATLVVYFPGETSLFLWVFTSDGFQEWKTVPIGREELYGELGRCRERFDEVVTRMSEGEPVGRGFGPAAEALASNPDWYRRNCAVLRESLTKLHSMLIAPVQDRVAAADPLLILPYGQLSYLPFEALIGPDGAFLGSSRRCVYFTGEQHLADTLAALHREARRGEDTFVAFADPRGRLPSSLQEVDEIAKFFARSEIHTKATGDASEEQVAALREDCTILHIATHGFLNGQKPSRTFLEMAMPPGDGMLAQAEIWPRLRKVSPGFRAGNVRLVVLSACETARAQDQPQAEVLGMPDAFTMAGAPAVVASLWSVYTYTTSDLMVEFYRRLAREGQDKAAALTGAKNALITGKEGRYAHPFFWAPFLLFGDWR